MDNSVHSHSSCEECGGALVYLGFNFLVCEACDAMFHNEVRVD